MITELIHSFSQSLAQQGLTRSRELRILEKGFINFSSNDYLALSDNSELKEAFIEGFSKYPIGSSASMVVCGYHPTHKVLEDEVAAALKVDEAILFNSGYSANLAIISLLVKLNSEILIDKAVHASIYDGINLTNAKYHRFKHNNMSDLQSKMTKITNSWMTIITEGIFSMSGEQAKLRELASLTTKDKAVIIVDESHSFGILGPKGRGLVAQEELSQDKVPLRLLTFGKAMGCQGAIIAGKSDWISLLVQTARPYIYTTGMSPAFSYGLTKAFKLCLEANLNRKKLFENIEYFRKNRLKSNLRWNNSQSQIQQLILGCPHRALNLASLLKENGIICMPMREPTVIRKDTGLRIVLRANQSFADIDKLFDKIHDLSC